MKKYQVTLDETQVDTLVRALDLYSRIGIGQLEEVVNIIRFFDHPGAVADPRCREGAESALNVVKKLLFDLPANGSYGIHNEKVPNRFRVAWDIQKVIRHHLWKEREEDSIGGVDSYPPDQSVPDQPLAAISTIGEGVSEWYIYQNLPYRCTGVQSGLVHLAGLEAPVPLSDCREPSNPLLYVLADKIERAGFGNGEVTKEEVEKTLGIKIPKTLKSASVRYGKLRLEDGWESFCCLVYEKLTFEPAPEAQARGAGFRSQFCGRVLADAIRRLGV